MSLMASRSSAWALPSASPLRMAPMSVEMWPVSGSTTPWGLRTFGSKKSVARLMLAPAGSLGRMSWPLLPWRSMPLLSRLWPNRKAMVENSVAMAGSTFGL